MAKDLSALRDEAAAAVLRGKLGKAIELYSELEKYEPTNPAWPKRCGETHRRNGNNAAAVEAFERASEKYAHSGFLVQAIAVCKLILQIDPTHSAAIMRLAELVTPSKPAFTPAARGATQAGHESAPVAPTVEVPASAAIEASAAPTAATAAPPAPPAAPAPSAAPTAAPPAPPAAPAPPAPLAATSAAPRPVAPPPRAATQPGFDRAPAPPPRPAVPAAIPPPAAEALRPALARPAAPPPAPPPRVRPPVTLPPGGGLDVLELATLVPGSRALAKRDGSSSGLSVVPIDEPEHEMLELEIPKLQLDATSRLALLETPLFAGLPRGVLENLISRMSLVELAPGEVLFREGDIGASLYVISEGAVTVESAGKELAELGPSSFFGEIALVTDLPRSATIRAVGRVELLSIDRDLVREAATEQPEIVNVLLRFVRDRLVDRMTRTSPLFQPFVDAERRALAKQFELLEVVQGVPLVTQGERADGLYVLVAGRAEVWRNARPSEVTVLGSGAVFGETSLLGGGGAIANVRSATRVLALRMPESTFREVIMTHPQVLEYLGQVADQREVPVEEDPELVDLHLEMV